MHIDIKYFANSLICNEKIKEICELDFVDYKGPCFRAVKHSSDVELSKNDFLPSIMEKYGNTMPDMAVQLKYKNSFFSVSINRSLEELKELVKTVPSLRVSVCSYAVGSYSKKKGVVTSPGNKGHMDYFLFDPENKNPVMDFHFVIE